MEVFIWLNRQRLHALLEESTLHRIPISIHLRSIRHLFLSYPKRHGLEKVLLRIYKQHTM